MLGEYWLPLALREGVRWGLFAGLAFERAQAATALLLLFGKGGGPSSEYVSTYSL